MYIKKLEIRDYRNIAEAVIEPAPGVTVIRGSNGQGKTNAIEAVNFFAQGRAFRTRRERDLIRTPLLSPDVPNADTDAASSSGADTPDRSDKAGEEKTTEKQSEEPKTEIRPEIPKAADVKLGFNSKGRDIDEEYILAANGKKFLRGGAEIPRVSDFIGAFRAVLFAPEHMSLVKGGPGERRTFLDLAISQFDPLYLSSLLRYSRLIEQRNALLRSWKQLSQPARQTINAYTPQLAKEAAAIAAARGRYVDRLGLHVRSLMGEMTSEREKVGFSYAGLKSEADFVRIFDAFTERDIEAGLTTVGPHREDFEIIINGVSARSMASQGQQRAIVLCMKIAEGEIAKERTGEYPVCLFDDVMSEIDSERRKFILNSFPQRQLIITACDKELRGDATYEVSGGVFTRI